MLCIHKYHHCVDEGTCYYLTVAQLAPRANNRKFQEYPVYYSRFISFLVATPFNILSATVGSPYDTVLHSPVVTKKSSMASYSTQACKRSLVLFIPLFVLKLQVSNAQSIGIGTSTPDASSKVDIQASDKGILIPRLSTVQRSGIPSPAQGLLVYDTNTQGFWYWTGVAWQSLSTLNNTWTLSGNSATNPATNFVGTLDSKPLIFKTNNQRVGYIGLQGLDGNIFWGYQSGVANTSGYSNIAIGTNAFVSNTIGANNVAIGDSALFHSTQSDLNTAIGSKALYSTTILGDVNTAVGALALYSNTNGNSNTAIGYRALYSNTTGTRNIAIGYNSLSNNTTASGNIAMGYAALLSNSDGLSNTAIGFAALQDNTHGNYNTAHGYGALSSNSTGIRNTAIGYSALNTNLTGSYITGLGYNSDVLSNNLSNASAIGAFARVDCNNCMVLGSINGVNGSTDDTNIGIGTTSPTTRLEVNGKTKTGQLQVGNGSTFSNIESGTLAIGSNSSGYVSVTLTFPTAFASVPRVIATIRNEPGTNWNDTFAITTRSVSATQAVFNIQRADLNGAWAQNLQLDWIAIQ